MKIAFSLEDGIGSFVWELPKELSEVLERRAEGGELLLTVAGLEPKEPKEGVLRTVSDVIARDLAKVLLAFTAAYTAEGTNAIQALLTLQNDLNSLVNNAEKFCSKSG